MDDEQLDLPGVEKPTLLDFAGIIVGKPIARAVLIAMADEGGGVHVLADGHIFETDLPGIIGLGAKVIEKNMLKRLWGADKPGPAAEDAALAQGGG